MERERFELKVGIFVFVGILALGAIIIILGARQDMFSRQYPLYAEFEDVSGLKSGAPVRLSGLDVGIVEGIDFPKTLGDKKLRVRLMIRAEVRDRIRGDSKASVATQGVLGDKYVAISLGTTGDPVEKGTILPSEQPADYFAILETAGKALKNIESITGKVDTMLTIEEGGEAKKTLADLIATVTDVVKEVKTGDGLLHTLIYDEKAAKSVRNVEVVTANLAAITEDFRNGQGAIPTLIKDPKSKESVLKLLAAAENMEKASADLRVIVSRIEKGDGTIGALINDPGVYDDLRALLGRAKRNRVLRSVIRSTIDKNENLEKGGSAPKPGASPAPDPDEDEDTK